MISKTQQSGFTLIELMIVATIIGILAAIAVPAYQNYTIRAQVTEGLSLAAGWKTSVSEYFAQNGSFPTCFSITTPGAAGCVAVTGASAGKYVSALAVSSATPGQIKVTYAGPQANAKLSIAATNTLTITPGLNSNNDVIWVCGKAATPAGTTLTGADATTVAAPYLPSTCHT